MTQQLTTRRVGGFAGTAAALSAVLLLGLSAREAGAVIPAKFQVQKVFADAGWVIAAKVAGVIPPAAPKAVQIEPDGEPLKGKAPEGKIGVSFKEVEDAAEFLKGLKVGDRAIVLVLTDSDGTPSAGLLHLGDRWLKLSPPAGNSKFWAAAPEPVMPGSFPGRTAALEQLLKDAKAGKAEYANDEIDHNLPGLKTPKLVDLGDLGVKPTAVVAAGGLLFVESSGGLKAFKPEGGKLAATAHKDSPAMHPAGADKVPDRDKAVPGGILAEPSGGRVIAVYPERIAVWDLGGAEPVDTVTFTGLPQPRKGQKFIGAGTVTVGGKPAVYVLAEDGGDWLLTPRGYGAFFAHNNPPLVKRSEWKLDGKPAPTPAFVASLDVDGDGAADIVFVTADGKAFAWLNAPAK
jgi:hypothetical protein